MKSINNYAKEFIPISQDDSKIIMHARKSLLYDKGTAWSKKDSDNTEVCELVGLYILSILLRKYGKSKIGLYRDDGLAAFGSNSQISDRIRKEITKVFEDQGLNITIQANLEKSTSLMSPSTSRQISSYKPHKKPNDNPIYIYTKSNHPPNIIKQLPKNISKRINKSLLIHVRLSKNTMDLQSSVVHKIT